MTSSSKSSPNSPRPARAPATETEAEAEAEGATETGSGGTTGAGGDEDPLPGRLLLDSPAPGAWNMAVDEALLESARANGARPTLRWYGWDSATLSLGYFQFAAELPKSLADLPLVRRLTGGGAIIHDRELTYSLVFPAGSWPRERHLDLVLEFHQFVAESLSNRPDTHIGAERAVEAEKGAEPFLCFDRHAPVDVVMDTSKVVGSAQRMRGGVLLQHGSILLAASPRAPMFPGLAEFGCHMPMEDIMESVTRLARQRWKVAWTPGALTERERTRAEELAREKYSMDSWNRRT